MKRLQQTIFASLFAFLALFLVVPQTQAATFRNDETIILSNTDQSIKNPYLFGETIRLTSPVDGDVVSAGGNINIEGETSGSTNIAGGNLTIKGTTGNSVRAAGGNIVIDGDVANDVVIAGGNVTITENAKIGGDVLFAGGNLKVDGPIAGKLQVAGGQINVNSTVGRGFEGEVGQLAIGPSAVINGDLKYKSEDKAKIDSGARITGKTTYEQRKDNDTEDDARALVTGGSIYKLITDILISLLLVFFLGRFVQAVVQRVRTSPVKNAAIGFSFAVLFPAAAVIMLLLIELGLAAFLFYALVLLVATYITKLLVGWFVMRWWEQRNNHDYVLDWKAAVVGPIILFLLLLIPVLGWLAAAILFLIALGGLLQELVGLVQTQKIERKAVKKKS